MQMLIQEVQNPDAPNLKPEQAARVLRALARFAGKPDGSGEVLVVFRRGGVQSVRVSEDLS